VTLALWLVAGLSSASTAVAASRHASMVVDANTGRVIQADSPDEPRYPASLTKIMTILMVFEEIRQGRLRPDTPITISAEAASTPPSRLGLREGATITVRDAVRALVTKSANDIAVAIAEHIGGNEASFARMMTRMARELGMTSTTFRNPHGLPDREQITTARDMITLGLRLYDNYPSEARVFALRSFHYAGRNHRNNNTMLSNFDGMEGIKTGYTIASGFNLLASARRDGRHVVAVVFGGRSAAARNARMRVMLSRGMQSASTERTRRPLLVTSRAVPTRPVRVTRITPSSIPAAAPAPSRLAAAIPPVPPLVEPVAPAVRHTQEVHRSADAPLPGGWRSEVRVAAPITPGTSVASRLGVHSDWQPAEVHSEPARRPSTLDAQAARLYGRTAYPAPMSDRSSTPSPRPVSAEIQVGAYSAASEARQRLEAVRRISPDLLSGADLATPAVNTGGRTLYRARFTGLDADTASSACARLRSRRIDCLVTTSQ
jgi:D-alanyl-D-alanine carboxypeptidase